MDWSPIVISLKTASAATVLTFFLGIYAARIVFSMKSKHKYWLDTLFTLPLVFPPTVAGFMLLFLFGVNGPIGRVLLEVGVKIIFSWWATVIAAVVISFPLMYRSAKGAFEQVDENLIYAGRTLGISERRIFWKVMIPIALPGIASGAILAFARALGEFGATIMVAGNIPKVTRTIPLSIYLAVQEGDMKTAGIWVGIIMIISFLVVGGMNYYAKRE